MKFSLKYFIELNLNIFQLYNRIKLRINKAILDYFKQNNNDDPLGKMHIDLRNGIVIKKINLKFLCRNYFVICTRNTPNTD